MFVTTGGRGGAPKALRTATYDRTIIYNNPVEKFYQKDDIKYLCFVLHG
jgi:hypothetical protein